MKLQNSTKHDGLENQAIRDLIGRELHALVGVRGDEAELSRRIANLQAEIDQIRRKIGFLALLRHFGWERHDAQYDIADFKWETYFDFIGTEAEYDALLARYDDTASTKIYLAICEDRHIDIKVRAFDSAAKAIAFAKSFVADNARHQDGWQEKSMQGCVYYCQYSCEGDHVRVEESELG